MCNRKFRILAEVCGRATHVQCSTQKKEIQINLESNIRALHLGYDVKKPRVYTEPRVTVLFGLQEK